MNFAWQRSSQLSRLQRRQGRGVVLARCVCVCVCLGSAGVAIILRRFQRNRQSTLPPSHQSTADSGELGSNMGLPSR